MWFDPQRALAAIEGAERAPSQPREGGSPAGAAPRVAQVARVARTPPPKLEMIPSAGDAEALLDVLRRDGPLTCGAAAAALGWGATRAWQAEAQLRAAGLVLYGMQGDARPLIGSAPPDTG